MGPAKSRAVLEIFGVWLSKRNVRLPQTVIDGPDLQNILAWRHDGQSVAFSFPNQVCFRLIGQSQICPN